MAARQEVAAAAYKEAAAVLTLDGRGMIRDCNRAGETLFKYRRGELVRHHISMLVPELAALDLVQKGQPNPDLRFLSRVGRHFQAIAGDGKSSTIDLFLNLLDGAGAGRLSLVLRPADKAGGAAEGGW